MKSSDIKIGETYGYSRYRIRNGLGSDVWLAPIKVTDIRKERVSNRTTYGTRETTLIVGINAGTEIKVEAKHIHATWDEVLTARREYKVAVAKGQARDAEVRAQRDQQLVRLETILRDRGVEPTFDDYLGVGYVHKQTGEVVPSQPKGYAYGDDPEWDYVNYTVKTYFNRAAILRGQKIELTPTALLALLEG